MTIFTISLTSESKSHRHPAPSFNSPAKIPRKKILRSVGRFLTSGGILIFLLLAFRSVYARVTDGVIAISETSTEYSLIGEWKFSVENRDGNLMPDFDDSSWQKIRIPANWSQTEFNGTNIGIYRCRIRTGPAFRSLDLGIMTPFIQSAHEVYFNGSLVGRAGLISPDGRILEKSTRVKVYRIPSRLLRPDGDNSLVIRVLGNGGVGGIVQGDFFLGSWESMDRRYINFHLWNGMLMAVFFFVGIYNLLLFFLRMQERSYLFFSLFTNAIGMTITGVKTLGYAILNSYDFNHLILNAGLIVSPACLALYFESHFGRRLPFFSSALIIVAGIALPIVPVTLLSDSVFGFFYQVHPSRDSNTGGYLHRVWFLSYRACSSLQIFGIACNIFRVFIFCFRFCSGYSFLYEYYRTGRTYRRRIYDLRLFHDDRDRGKIFQSPQHNGVSKSRASPQGSSAAPGAR